MVLYINLFIFANIYNQSGKPLLFHKKFLSAAHFFTLSIMCSLVAQGSLGLDHVGVVKTSLMPIAASRATAEEAFGDMHFPTHVRCAAEVMEL
jgi:hypothetical protein